MRYDPLLTASLNTKVLKEMDQLSFGKFGAKVGWDKKNVWTFLRHPFEMYKPTTKKLVEVSLAYDLSLSELFWGPHEVQAYIVIPYAEMMNVRSKEQSYNPLDIEDENLILDLRQALADKKRNRAFYLAAICGFQLRDINTALCAWEFTSRICPTTTTLTHDPRTIQVPTGG